MMEELIEKVVRRVLREQSFTAIVKSVDAAKDTCVVEIEETELEIEDVALKAMIDNTTSKVVIYPKVGKPVTCSILHNDENQVYISKYSEVDQIVVDCENVVINGGNNGGLCITPVLKTELNKTKDVITAITQVISGAPIPEPGSGAVSAFQASLQAALTGINTGDYSEIENTKIKH